MNGRGIKVRTTEGIEVGDQPAFASVPLEDQTFRLSDFLIGTLPDVVAPERAGEPWIFGETGLFSEDPDEQIDDAGTDPSNEISERFHWCLSVAGW